MGYSLCLTPSTVPSLRLRCVTSSALAPGTPPVSPRTAKPWFCEVISTCPVARSRTGWFPPPVTRRGLHRLPAERQTEERVAETDPEKREGAVRQFAQRGDGI